jgi:hypothetical protein
MYFCQLLGILMNVLTFIVFCLQLLLSSHFHHFQILATTLQLICFHNTAQKKTFSKDVIGDLMFNKMEIGLGLGSLGSLRPLKTARL